MHRAVGIGTDAGACIRLCSLQTGGDKLRAACQESGQQKAQCQYRQPSLFANLMKIELHPNILCKLPWGRCKELIQITLHGDLKILTEVLGVKLHSSPCIEANVRIHDCLVLRAALERIGFSPFELFVDSQQYMSIRDIDLFCAVVTVEAHHHVRTIAGAQNPREKP